MPAVLRAINPGAFPHDAVVLDAQGRLMVLDEMLAGMQRASGLSLETLFFAGYLLSVGLLWAGIVLIGQRVYRTWWATAALAAAVTLRHRIPRTSANSFEPYFYPRMLAFAIGVVAIAAVLRHRRWLAVGLVAVAAVVHVTTGVWFAILIGVALAMLDARMRQLAVAGALAAGAVALWAAATGQLGASFAPMDDVWLTAVASKDSLFATLWPAWVWVANLGLLGLLWWAYRRHRRDGRSSAEDTGIVWGATALVGVFVATLPLVAAAVTLPVQLQISRVFWLVDFVATVYVIAVVADGSAVHTASRVRRFGAPQVVAGLLLLVSAARGAYIMLVERPDRALFAVSVPDSAWEDAMRWLTRQPPGVNVLADPGHAWKYGTSVRASGQRDVVLEEVKDSALAIYSREVAGRVVERTAAIGDFAAMTPERARELARRYDADYLITEAELALPLAYRNSQFRVYTLQ